MYNTVGSNEGALQMQASGDKDATHANAFVSLQVGSYGRTHHAWESRFPLPEYLLPQMGHLSHLDEAAMAVLRTLAISQAYSFIHISPNVVELHIYIYIYIYTHIYIYIYMYIYIYIHIIYIYHYTTLLESLSLSIYIYIYTYVYIPPGAGGVLRPGREGGGQNIINTSTITIIVSIIVSIVSCIVILYY